MTNITASELVKIRQSGQKPDSCIIVSMVAPLRVEGLVEGPIITHRDSNNYAGLYDLFVVIAHDSQNLQGVVELVNQILNFNPLQLETWNIENDEWVAVESFGQRLLMRVPPSW